MATETSSVQDSILEALAKGTFTIEELSANIGMHRTTVSKYLAVMEAAKLVEYRNIGKAKMFFLPKPFYKKCLDSQKTPSGAKR